MKTTKLFQFLLAFCLLLPILACQKDDVKTESTVPSQIIGTWECIEYPYEDIIFMVRLQFKDDGSYLGDSWELRYGVQGYENALLNKAQVTALVRNKPWSIHVEAGKWSIKDNNLFSVGGFYGDVVSKYTLANNILIIDWDVDGKGYIESEKFFKSQYQFSY